MKSILVILSVLMLGASFSQDVSGEITYSTKINIHQNIPDTERGVLVDSRLNRLFAGERKAIDDSVASGSSLIKKQKLKALMRSLPESVREHGDYAAMETAVNRSLYGNTEQSLLAKENREVGEYNTSKKNQFNKDYDKYNKNNKQESMSSLIKILETDYGFSYNDD